MSQDTVAMQMRCGEIFSDHIIVNLLMSVPVRVLKINLKINQYLKILNIGQYLMKLCLLFFVSLCIY